MKTRKEIRKQYYMYLSYYFKRMRECDFKEADNVYPKVFALAWVLWRVNGGDFAGLCGRLWGQ
ncbi:hypothetical protein, partial [Phascolarctobacterium succinatutens]|uniref:hypothetical protein n=1 Tax=Phascolarctobacterium succinatutens TaxID=626940 RepID=UPI00307A5456